VFQEAILARKSLLYCGTASIDLDKVMAATAWLRYKQWQELRAYPLGFHGVLNMWFYRKDRKRMVDDVDFMWTLIGNTGGFECSDLRDRVFGLVGLYQLCMQRTELPSALIPDYHKDPVAVIRNATQLAIEESSDPIVWWNPSFQRRSGIHSLPSWVPEFIRDIHDDEGLFLGTSFKACGSYKRDGCLACSTVCSPTLHNSDGLRMKEDILSLPGIAVDSISLISPRMVPAIMDDAAVLTMQLRKILRMTDSIVQDSSALGMTLIGRRRFDDTEAAPEDALSYMSFLDYISTRHELPAKLRETGDSTSDAMRSIIEFYEAFRHHCFGRSLFTTEGNRIGTAPDGVEPGDVIAILRGGRLPFILRRHGDYYTVVGTAYVHGIMYGEALERPY
jgi:hypothetical protein